MAVPHKLTDLEVSNAVRSLTVEQVRDLVHQIGVPLNELDNIAAQYHDAENQKQHFVQKWLDMNPDASWAKLVAGLRGIKMITLAANIESVRSVSLVPSSILSPPPEASTAVQLQTASMSATRTGPLVTSPYPSSLSPSPSSQLIASFTCRVGVTGSSIEHLEEEFSNIKCDARISLSTKERENPNFVDRFRDHLLELPVAKKQVHIHFFVDNEEDILAAKTIQKIFIILGRYCNYINYEIILHIVKRFCKELKQRMLSYRDSLTAFEKTTTVDVYLCAISARPDGKVSAGFVKMTMKIRKAPSDCTLHEIRELKESIDEEASLESYTMYIESPVESSVCVCLRVPERAGWMVGVVLTPDFRQKHLLSEVTVRRWRLQGKNEESLSQYLVRSSTGYF